MSNEKRVFGYIDCPTCGTQNGVRITHDKNGEPFGYCEATCRQQLRIGGDAERVAAFVRRYPWAKPDAVTAPAPAPAAAAKPVTVTAPAPAPAAAAKPVTAPAPARSSMADALAFLGVKT